MYFSEKVALWNAGPAYHLCKKRLFLKKETAVSLAACLLYLADQEAALPRKVRKGIENKVNPRKAADDSKVDPFVQGNEKANVAYKMPPPLLR